ncbi:MAG TPA: DUF4160 domain-containing protein [Caulobacterales bacterium]|jgi:hypothetical protein|nr:DUF4160 domain-containing protein [Caulobacterales bacterium]
MPSIATFYGITIYMYWADHLPPHLHAIYGADEAVFDIQTGEVIFGDPARTARRLVQDWIALRREALLENWRRGQSMLPFERVPGPDDAA